MLFLIFEQQDVLFLIFEQQEVLFLIFEQQEVLFLIFEQQKVLFLIFEKQKLLRSHATTRADHMGYSFFTNRVHMRAMEVSGPPSDAEFRSASF